MLQKRRTPALWQMSPSAYHEAQKECLDPFSSSLSHARPLKDKGIEQLYSHQAAALKRCRLVVLVVVTPTASGKTSVQSPGAENPLEDEEARALYLFPTKALAQDQVAELMAWSDSLGGKIRPLHMTNTPGDARIAIRAAGSIVVTNPDMLHSGILPHHQVDAVV